MLNLIDDNSNKVSAAADEEKAAGKSDSAQQDNKRKKTKAKKKSSAENASKQGGARQSDENQNNGEKSKMQPAEPEGKDSKTNNTEQQDGGKPKAAEHDELAEAAAVMAHVTGMDLQDNSENPQTATPPEHKENVFKKWLVLPKNLKISSISKIDDQVKDVIDEALDEDAESLGLTEEQAPSSTVSLSQVMSALFGVFLIGFAIFGVISAIGNFREYSINKQNRVTEMEYLERLILPLTACDIPTFEDAEDLNSDVTIAAACWDIILSPSSAYNVENGNYIISCLEIESRINKLFGSGLSYTHATVGDQELLFKYDEETGMYTIPAAPRAIAYYPTIDSFEVIENGYTLTVSYHVPVSEWISITPSPDKTMIYTVKGNGLSYTISSVEVGHISPDGL